MNPLKGSLPKGPFLRILPPSLYTLEPPGFLKTPDQAPRIRIRKPQPGQVCCSSCLEYWDKPDYMARIDRQYYCHHCAPLAERITLRCRRNFRETVALLAWGAAAGAGILEVLRILYGGPL